MRVIDRIRLMHSTATVVAAALAQLDGNQAAAVTDGAAHTVTHMVNMALTANRLHNKLHTLDITKSLADNFLIFERKKTPRDESPKLIDNKIRRRQM